MIIVFNSETRQFSAFDETREFGEKWNNFKGHVGKNSTVYAGGAGMLVGAGAGSAIARSKAKKAAADRGLEPGTPEYKKFVRQQTAKGAGIGAGAGLVTGAGAEIGYRRGKEALGRRKYVKQGVKEGRNADDLRIEYDVKNKKSPLIKAAMFRKKDKK